MSAPRTDERMNYGPVQVIEVVRTELELRGKGVEGDPMRRIVQFWSRDGELLAEVDSLDALKAPS